MHTISNLASSRELLDMKSLSSQWSHDHGLRRACLSIRPDHDRSSHDCANHDRNERLLSVSAAFDELAKPALLVRSQPEV